MDRSIAHSSLERERHPREAVVHAAISCSSGCASLMTAFAITLLDCRTACVSEHRLSLLGADIAQR